jgi:hypothetical protein
MQVASQIPKQCSAADENVRRKLANATTEARSLNQLGATEQANRTRAELTTVTFKQYHPKKTQKIEKVSTWR